MTTVCVHGPWCLRGREVSQLVSGPVYGLFFHSINGWKTPMKFQCTATAQKDFQLHLNFVAWMFIVIFALNINETNSLQYAKQTFKHN